MIGPGAVYVLGDLNVDVLLSIDSYPELGGDRRSEKLVMEVGGSATNSAILLSRLGLTTSLLACHGEGLFGQFARQALESTELNLTHLRSEGQESTGLMFIPVTKAGQRTLFGQRGANHLYRHDDLPDELSKGSALHLSGYALLNSPQSRAAEVALKRARQAGMFIAMDTAYEPPLIAPSAFRPILTGLDLIVLGEEEARTLAGEEEIELAIEWLLNQGIAIVALKLGSRGSQLYSEHGRFELPIIPVDVVDTTGAGDSFSGALLYGLLAGIPPAAAGWIATAAAAHAVGVWGAGRQVAHVDDLKSLLDGFQLKLGRTKDENYQLARQELEKLEAHS
jgi:ribokinase